MLGNLGDSINVFKITDAIVAGQDGGLVESSAIDCAGYDRMLVILRVGATATNLGVLDFYLEDCLTSGGTYAKMEDTAIAHTFGASGETNKYHIIDQRLSKRYAKVAYQRKTQDSAFIHCTAILYNGKRLPEATPDEVKTLKIA